jgi:hypothetical protein
MADPATECGSSPIARSNPHLTIANESSTIQHGYAVECSFRARPLCETPAFYFKEGSVMTQKQMILLCAAAFLGGIVGGLVSTQLLSPRFVEAQKPNGVNAEEFLLLDAKGKARAGLGLDAHGEVGFVLTSKDGNRTLTLSPDDPSALKLVERGGQTLWKAP